MILDHFGLNRHPFTMSTPPEAFYHSQAFQEASKRLDFLLSMQEGIGLLTAEPGVGKSTFLDHYFQENESENLIVRYSFTTLTPYGLISSINRRVGLRPQRFKAEMALQLMEWFSNSSRIPILVLDEAQDLPDPTLEDLRLLTSSHSSLVMILCGQPLLRERLAQPANHSLDQRVVVSYSMPPFSRLETEEYISFRFKAAGLKEAIVDEKPLDLIFELTHGVARKINRLVTGALVDAASRKKKFIDERAVQNAQHDIESS